MTTKVPAFYKLVVTKVKSQSHLQPLPRTLI